MAATSLWIPLVVEDLHQKIEHTIKKSCLESCNWAKAQKSRLNSVLEQNFLTGVIKPN